MKIIVASFSNYFEYYKLGLVKAFNKYGLESIAMDVIDYDYKPDAIIIIGPALYLKEKFKYRNDIVYAAIQTEQFANPDQLNLIYGQNKFRNFKRYYKKYDVIFEWSRNTFFWLSKKYSNIYFIPHCHFNNLIYHFEDNSENLNGYDLLFIGDPASIDNRRERLLNHLAKKFKIYDKYNGLWGREKELAILNSKICLNIHYDNSYCFESPRMYEYLANKKFVLSEKIFDPYPFTENVDYISFNYHEDIINKIEYYMDHDEERAIVASSGYEKAMAFPIDQYINEIVDKINLMKDLKKNKFGKPYYFFNQRIK